MNETPIARSAYTGTKAFTQQHVQTANATGFGAAADDFMERGIDLNEALILNKAATYFFRMSGNAMEASGIFNNDVLIVDRSIKATTGKTVVVVINGDLLVRRYNRTLNQVVLIADNTKFRDIVLDESISYTFWGVVTYVIHRV